MVPHSTTSNILSGDLRFNIINFHINTFTIIMWPDFVNRMETVVCHLPSSRTCSAPVPSCRGGLT